MKYEDLIGWTVTDVAIKELSKTKVLILQKGDKILMLEPKRGFDVYDLLIRKGEVQK